MLAAERGEQRRRGAAEGKAWHVSQVCTDTTNYPKYECGRGGSMLGGTWHRWMSALLHVPSLCVFFFSCILVSLSTAPVAASPCAASRCSGDGREAEPLFFCFLFFFFYGFFFFLINYPTSSSAEEERRDGFLSCWVTAESETRTLETTLCQRRAEEKVRGGRRCMPGLVLTGRKRASRAAAAGCWRAQLHGRMEAIWRNACPNSKQTRSSRGGVLPVLVLQRNVWPVRFGDAAGSNAKKNNQKTKTLLLQKNCLTDQILTGELSLTNRHTCRPVCPPLCGWPCLEYWVTLFLEAAIEIQDVTAAKKKQKKTTFANAAEIPSQVTQDREASDRKSEK